MKGLLRRLHLGGGSQDNNPEGGGMVPKSRNRFSFSETSSATPSSESHSPSSESRTLSSFSGWLNAAKQTLHQSGSPKHKKENGGDKKDEGSNSRHSDKEEIDRKVENEQEHPFPTMPFLPAPPITSESKSSDAPSSAVYKDAQDITIERVQRAALQVASDQALFLQDEELQVRVALALSVHDDPEATAIENAKDLSLGSELSLSNTTAEVLAYRYWRYNVLNYDDKVVDGFYDVYGVALDFSSGTMPALIDLQETAVLDKISWEVVLVNRATDNNLVNLEQKAISIALKFRVGPGGLKRSGLANRIAVIVADQMGGPVNDEALLHKRWRANSAELRVSLGNVVLPLGRLQIGLGRHRALLFKVLADAVGIPCQLLKGKQYTGSDEGAVNIIKVDTGREYIIDLMGAPGTLLPSDLPGMGSSGSNLNLDQEDSIEEVMTVAGSEVHGGTGSLKDVVSGVSLYKAANVNEVKAVDTYRSEPIVPESEEIPVRPSGVRSVSHWRSPSWTEGISSPAVRDMKVKDVSQYMMDAAKENPKLAQKLHDVLVESGVKAPPDLFDEISPKQLTSQINEERKILDDRQVRKAPKGINVRRKEKTSVGPGRPPAPKPSHDSSSAEDSKDRSNRLSSVEGLGESRPLDPSGLNLSPGLSTNLSASSEAVTVQPAAPVLPASAAISLVQENLPPELIIHVPVAAAAAATAAVVASSMVAAATKTEHGSGPTLEVPLAAAATATAAVVVATTAVVGRRMEMPLAEPIKEDESEQGDWQDLNRRHKEVDAYVKGNGDNNKEGQGSGGADKHSEDDRVSDKSIGSMSTKSDRILEDVAEWEIPWEELVIGERIGLGSYGEVYHGDWHGTEVAVKKFLEQDISGDALEEFRSEVRLMKRMRHPNVVLFMGAVMRAPNLSIVTEFLPRGSLYRLIHRSNGNLDERRRMRMALDVARGMNYLHNSTPVIVHRDLKSPNLLVDKNWVVKVCDFGLSRLKHSTFLSSKSTAGTPEWMAPEVLRNEPSNEKSDVYSFGVILWELATLQQPWAGMNPMQVVGAVGFQQRTLDIPENMDPVIVKIIRQCWQSDPALRPSFAEIMAALKPLQRPLTQAQSAKA